MSYNNTNNAKAHKKRNSFKATHVAPYSPPSSRNAGNNNGTTTSSKSHIPSSVGAHGRAATFAQNNRNKINQLQAVDQQLLDNNNSSTTVPLKGGRPDSKGQIKSKLLKSQNNSKSSKHMPSQSIAVTNKSASKTEKVRTELYFLWDNANLLEQQLGYRKSVWKHMANQLWANDSVPKFKYENYKDKELPDSDEKESSLTSSNRRSSTNKPATLSSTGDTTITNKHGGDSSRNNDSSESKSEEPFGEYVTRAKLEMMIRRKETYEHFNLDPNDITFMDTLSNEMKSVLTAYAVANYNRLPLKGVVQLCSVILVTLSKEKNTKNSIKEGDTFYLLQILTHIMRPYYHNKSEAIKNETLLLVDVLCNTKATKGLVNHLNKVKIDVIDLATLTCAWIGALFSQHFHLKFVQRVIDLVLLEGPTVLISLVYGIFHLMKNDLRECKDANQVFDLLSGKKVPPKYAKIEEYLEKPEFINKVIAQAQLIITFKT